MVKIVTILASATLLAAVAVSANAQEKGSTYLQAGAGVLDADGERFNVVQFVGGYNLNRNFAAEAELGLGVSEKRYQVGSVFVDAKIKRTAGVYLVGSLPVADNLDLLGRVGFAAVSIEAKSGNVSADEQEEGPAFGVGLRYLFKGGVHGVRGDLTRYKLDEADFDTLKVSYVRRF
ncbi:porin family protein [Asticcacaulis excentricus]|uniref:Outer membrane protein beta-barrel domain-containing protein n=1 Tax=Asticcacaulis excentricus TaxID=78587 RepID=A0A3G9G3R6_9CAUL|nr:porin family protein [Asticcacaulis excentricus]BBF79703.1 hypothetical protein EM6_0273 [Asticcacaulis excentricus]